MADEGKTREQLISELEELRKQVADLKNDNAKLKEMEIDFLSSNRKCQELTAELDQKYREIKWHDEFQVKHVAELEQKEILLGRYIRHLKQKKLTIRILALLLAIVLICIGIAASLGKVGQFVKSIYEYEDLSYRPMDLEREGKPLPLKTGKIPTKQ